MPAPPRRTRTRTTRGTTDVPASLVERTLAEIRAGGGRVTPARRAVLAAILDAGGHHFTAAEIFAAVDDARPRPDRATVYRTLDLLTELGVLTPLQLDGDATVYHRADHRHGHLVCSSCGAIVELPEAALQLLAGSLEGETGFVVDTGRVAITGWCRACAGKDL
jgi:Fur family ferric uptake transcriptional regulator